MDVLFWIVALVGAVMAFGASLLRLFLEGVALINFISAEDAIVFGVMLLLALVNVGLWVYATRRSKRVATARCASVISASVIFLAYLVLLTSIWADAWLKSYVAWCTSCNTMLTVFRIIGWLMMMASLGWFGHKCYVALTTKVAHEVVLAEEPVITGTSKAQADHSGIPDWLVNMDGGDEEKPISVPVTKKHNTGTESEFSNNDVEAATSNGSETDSETDTDISEDNNIDAAPVEGESGS